MNPIDERDQAVRALLVDNAARPEPRRRRTTAVIAVVAFVLGGGLATGAVSAAFAATRAPLLISLPANAFDELDGGHTLGPLVTYTGSGDAHLNLGSRPNGATGIAWFLQCGEGRGRVLSTAVGGKTDSETSNCREGSGFGSNTEHVPTDSIVTIKTDGKFSYAIWAQWFAPPPPVEPSAAQKAAIADGTVTGDELRAADDRYVACMTGAGYPVTVTEYEPAPSFAGSAGEDIPITVQHRCNAAELQQVAAMWETAHK